MGATVGQLQSMVSKYNTQTEWKGWIVWAFFLGGLGAGLYLVSLMLNFTGGMILGLLIILIGKNGCHLIFLGRPERFWRAVSRPGTSWISRGIIGITLFCISGVLYLLPAVISSLSWGGGFNNFLLIISVISGLWVMIYTGFVMATSKAIPAWNSAVIPVIYVIFGFIGGIDIILIWSGVAAVELAYDIKVVELVQLALLALSGLLVGGYLSLLNNTSPTTKATYNKLVAGEYARIFIGGVILSGLVLAGILVLISYLAGNLPWIMVLAGVLALVGSFLLRWSLFKVGLYSPLL